MQQMMNRPIVPAPAGSPEQLLPDETQYIMAADTAEAQQRQWSSCQGEGPAAPSMPSMPPSQGSPGWGGSQLSQSQRMTNPVDMAATHSPADSNQAYQASLRSLLARNVGYFVVCTFQISSQQAVTWQGILHTVGSDYLVLYQPDQNKYVSCDFYALKFVQFHDTRNVPYCASAQAWVGRREM